MTGLWNANIFRGAAESLISDLQSVGCPYWSKMSYFCPTWAAELRWGQGHWQQCWSSCAHCCECGGGSACLHRWILQGMLPRLQLSYLIWSWSLFWWLSWWQLGNLMSRKLLQCSERCSVSIPWLFLQRYLSVYYLCIVCSTAASPLSFLHFKQGNP